MVAIPRLYPHGEVTTSQGGSAEATEALPNGQSKTYGTMWVKLGWMSLRIVLKVLKELRTVAISEFGEQFRQTQLAT
eukprot:1825412-Pyramimonas_sp.AAC.1